MKLKHLFVATLLLAATPGFAQLTIEDCHQKARANYPLIKQYGLIEEAKQYSLDNLAKNYLPQVALNGQATYQSDVTNIPIDFQSLGLPVDIESVSKDQYKATIDVNQIIWDGGSTSAQRKITRAQSEVDNRMTDVSLYEIEDKVTQLFFGILAIDEKLKIIDLKEKDLKSSKEIIESMFRNETATQSDLDEINVELLNIDQNRTEQIWLKKAYCRMLSLFIHESVIGSTPLVKPDDSFSRMREITRPELSLFDSQTNLHNVQDKAITAKNMPKLSLFAQGGYGRVGLDMLNDDFDFFAIGGVKLSWNFGNLYTKKNEKRLLENKKRNVSVQRETFLFNTELKLEQDNSDIEKSRELLQKDDDIIALRNRVKKASESKFLNGVYQVNELIRDINAEEEARQTKALHEIQYLLSIHNYKHTQGK